MVIHHPRCLYLKTDVWARNTYDAMMKNITETLSTHSALQLGVGWPIIYSLRSCVSNASWRIWRLRTGRSTTFGSVTCARDWKGLPPCSKLGWEFVCWVPDTRSATWLLKGWWVVPFAVRPWGGCGRGPEDVWSHIPVIAT